MRLAISPEQKKFFAAHGYIEFDSLLTLEESKILLAQIQHISKESPGHPQTHLFRSIPFVLKLFKKKHLGEIAYTLIEKKPIRLEFDQYFLALPHFTLSEEQPLGLILFLSDAGKALFFKNEIPKRLYKDKNSCYVLVFNTHPLSNELNPLVFPIK